MLSRSRAAAASDLRGSRRPWPRQTARPGSRRWSSLTHITVCIDMCVWVSVPGRLGRPGLRHFLSPDVFAEPLVVVLHYRALLLGLVDRVSEAFVEDQLHGNAAVFQCLVKLERIGRGDALVLVAVLDQGRRPGAVDIRDGRSLA